jgi:hypothetical protein
MPGWRTYPTPSNKVTTPFAITPGSGAQMYNVDDGVIFTSFSFSTGTFLHIEGIKKDVKFDKGYKFYIEMDVLPNLQVEKAQIKCGEVGKKDNWASYPDLYEIEPKDEMDSNGKVTKIVNGKTQTKCYALIGYREDDPIKDPTAKSKPDLKAASDSAVQILNHNIILLASVLSGVPVIFPMPYFDGSTHLQMVRFEE